MRHDEYIIVGISSNGQVDGSDQGTERGRYLLQQFRDNNYLRKMSIPPGAYRFNIVQQGAEIVTTLDSLDDCFPAVHFESRSGNKSVSVQFQMGGGRVSGSWWTLPNFMLVCAILTGILLWIVL